MLTFDERNTFLSANAHTMLWQQSSSIISSSLKLLFMLILGFGIENNKYSHLVAGIKLYGKLYTLSDTGLKRD